MENRLNRKEYETIKKSLIGLYFSSSRDGFDGHYAFTESCLDKETFGDVDIVVDESYKSNVMTNILFNKGDDVVKYTGNLKLCPNHTIFEMYSELFNKTFTVDVIYSKNLNFTVAYHSYGGIGSILGVLLKQFHDEFYDIKCRLKLTDTHLSVCYEGESILVTSNFNTVFKILGIDADNFIEYDTTPAAKVSYDYIVNLIKSSPHYNQALFSENRPHNKGLCDRPLFKLFSCEEDKLVVLKSMQELGINTDIVLESIKVHLAVQSFKKKCSASYNGNDIIRVMNKIGADTYTGSVKRVKSAIPPSELQMLPKNVADDIVEYLLKNP